MCEKTIEKMKEIFKDVSYGVDHTLKVLQNVEEIIAGENYPDEEREAVSLMAILHDIGAVEALKKHGSIAGYYQELEGPALVRGILAEIAYDPEKVERIAYVVGHHHTPAKIDGLDFQILWEADLLESLASLNLQNTPNDLGNFINENFKTPTGRALALKRLC